MKVYYTSRTHSQLAQVIGELHRLRIPTTAPQTSGEADEHAPTVRVVSLGSRKQLCINKPLIDSGGDLDEKCRELLAGSLRKHVLVFSTDTTKENLVLGVDSSHHGRMKRSFLSLETRFWYRYPPPS
jgi:chromosome transmission fidelity protein 1